jgi:NAD(P)-dependent dehydrogenase (short-subunit alcohol dehydrogenase family)
MKKYDLMHQINTRGTYLVSKTCLPYLKKSSNPHILNLSPPLNMHAKWFAPHVAYTMAKYGMSMCVLGMSEEFSG